MGFFHMIKNLKQLAKDWQPSPYYYGGDCTRSYISVKSERINALRQKYEAFLEEDRKRKERNEYILGQLDKMRTCNTIVQKYKLSPFEENVSMFPKISTPTAVHPVGVAVQQRRSLRVPFRSDFETNPPLLQKILSNFILIPKRAPENIEIERAPRTEEHTENSDWKTKYEILNLLKNAEKAGSETINDSHLNQKEDMQEYQNRVHSFDVIKDIPKKGIFFDEMIEPSGKKHSEISDLYPTKVGKDYQDDNITNDFTVDSSRDIHEEEINKGYQIGEVQIKSNEKLVYDEENGMDPAHIYYPHEDVGKPLGEIPKETEDMQYPIDIINVDEFTPRDDVILKDGENSHPTYKDTMSEYPDQHSYGGHDTTLLPTSEGDKNQQDAPLETQLIHETLDKPLLKAKEVEDESFTMQAPCDPVEQVTEFADRAGTVNTNKPENLQADILEQNPVELAGNVYSPLTQNVQEQQQYYYEAPHENPESVFISEHEETSSPYDQSYTQQYAAAPLQGYEQTADVTATTNQWEVPLAYTEPQIYEEPEQYEGQEQNYAVAEQAYEGQDQTYAGIEQPYAGQQQEYSGREQNYEQNNLGLEQTYTGPEQAYIDQNETYSGVEQTYVGPDQNYAGQQQTYGNVERTETGPEQAYTGEELTYEGQRAYASEEPSQGQQEQYDTGAYQQQLYDENRIQPVYNDQVYDVQGDVPQQYSQDPANTAEETFESTKEIEQQLDREEGYIQQHEAPAEQQNNITSATNNK